MKKILIVDDSQTSYTPFINIYFSLSNFSQELIKLYDKTLYKVNETSRNMVKIKL